MGATPQISVVIVNFNVKDYLEQALYSLQRALAGFSHEIYVVDNASVDGSAAHIRHRFPEVHLIESAANLGFGRANNVALRRVRGEYVVLINPDTVVQEDTFQELMAFFVGHPQAAAATCKILNPDGSFSVDCRHSIPTPMIAFWKVTGLSRLFPRSRIFARYNLTYLDPDDTYPVPAISGSFMMLRKAVLDEVGLFDERFFMYCEDIDLCHRINQAGFTIYYVPATQIIHYKGESTRKNRIDYVITFNRALYQFFQKYYAQKTLLLFRWIILLGIVIRGVVVFCRNFLHEHFPLLLDTLLLNAAVLGSFMLRFEALDGFYWRNFWNNYWIINIICTVIFLGSAYYLDIYPRHRFSIQGIIKANILTFTLLASLTFFLNQFAFSRIVVLIASVATPLCLIGWRAILKRYYRGDRSAWGKDVFSKPTVLVGQGEPVKQLYQKIRDMHDLSYELLGVVTIDQEENPRLEASKIPLLGQLENLRQLVRIHGIRQVIFSSEELPYARILETMTRVGSGQVEFKIAPSSLEVMIGKSSIERLDDYPLLEIEYAIGKPFNRWTKRSVDLLTAAGALLLAAPLCWPLLLWNRSNRRRLPIVGEGGRVFSLLQVGAPGRQKLLNRWLQLWEVLRGRLSLVGAPLNESLPAGAPSAFWYKPGLTGLVQINQDKIASAEDTERYHLFYLKNQSILLDLEILFKSLTR